MGNVTIFYVHKVKECWVYLVGTPASCLGGPVWILKEPDWDLLVVLFGTLTQLPGQILKWRQECSVSFLFHCALIILALDAAQSGLLKASLNKQRINKTKKARLLPQRRHNATKSPLLDERCATYMDIHGSAMPTDCTNLNTKGSNKGHSQV
jgi:hypothetical protein